MPNWLDCLQVVMSNSRRTVESVPLLHDNNYRSSSRRQKRYDKTTEFYVPSRDAKQTPSVPPGVERNEEKYRRQRTERPPPRYETDPSSSQYRFRPYFIVTVTLVEVVVFVYEIVAGGIAPVSFTPVTEELVSVPIFGQNYNETVKRGVVSNWFIGPDPSFFVHNAAKFTLVSKYKFNFFIFVYFSGCPAACFSV